MSGIVSSEEVAALSGESPLVSGKSGGWRRVVAAPWKLLVGMTFCRGVFGLFWIGFEMLTGFLGSILVVGWTYRLMQRFAFKQWWKRSPRCHSSINFRSFAASEASLRGHVEWPNWFVAQRAARSVEALGFFARFLGSLWLNFRTGLLGIFNTWVFTLPACLIWLSSWFAGWNISFNKGYEQAWVGPVTFLLGVAVFIAAMFYVPMAQARQAVTGEFKAFYHYRRVRQVIKTRWFSAMLLAAAYSILALPVSLLLASPMFQGTGDSQGLMSASPQEQLQYLRGYYFACLLYVFPAFVVLRLIAARIYASAVLELVKRGDWGPKELGAAEAGVLEVLELAEKGEVVERSKPSRMALWAASNGGRITAGAITVVIWFTFVAQILVGQFLHYHPGRGWLNQSLVQLPWFNHVPAALYEAAKEE